MIQKQKQYRKGREPLFPLFSCDMKKHCGPGSCCGERVCHLTTHKRWAKKDDKGKPIKSGMWIDRAGLRH